MNTHYRSKYLEALLTQQGDFALYRENAYFHQVLDTYIDMIPIFVDGLREHAKVEGTRLRNIETQLRNTASTFNMPDGWNDT